MTNIERHIAAGWPAAAQKTQKTTFILFVVQTCRGNELVKCVLVSLSTESECYAMQSHS
jgi:hypothetical protein